MNESKFHSTVIFVKNIDVSKKFYLDTLRQVIDLDFGNNVLLKSGITLWQVIDNHIIPEKLGKKSITDKTCNRFELYFETDNIEEVFRELSKSDVKLLHSIHEEPWGQRNIRFFDPDDHLIEIGETLAVFVKRLFKENLNFEQISRKTGIPLAEVVGIIKK